MTTRKRSRLSAGQQKALLLPMDRVRASELILRTRLWLECARKGKIDRRLINHLAQVCIISGYIARAGYSRIPPETFDSVEQELARALADFDASGRSDEMLPAPLLHDLTEVVNEYDRILSTVRLGLLAKASDYLAHMMDVAAASGSA